LPFAWSTTCQCRTGRAAHRAVCEFVWKLRSALVAALLLLVGTTVSAADIRVGTGSKVFSIAWLEGFSYKPAGQSQRWVGPNGELVIVTSASPRLDLPATSVADAVEKHGAFATSRLPSLAAANGKVIRPLTKEQVSSGATLYSTATQSRQMLKEYFYLQFFLVSPHADVALITVEGYGQAEIAFERFRPLLDSANWSTTDPGAFTDRVADKAQTTPSDESGFTERVAGLLRKEVGDAPVVVASPLTIRVGELQANLDRIFAFCKRNADKCEPEVDRYVKATAQVLRERLAPPTREAVRVVLRSEQYVQAAQSSVGGSEAEIQPRQFVGGLVALPVLDSPRALRMLGPKDNEQLGLSAQEVYELGRSNLARELKPLMDVAKAAGRGQIGRLVGDSFHPSRLLFVDSWAPLAQAQGGTLIVAVPATDAVLYIGEDSALAIDALRALVMDVMARAPNRLSSVLLRWRESGWEVVR